MPKKDPYHEEVRLALEKDGWTVTHDPLRLKWRDVTYLPDLGAEKILGAEKNTQKIAVEIKTFLGRVFQHEFYEAIGQYDSYALALSETEPDRVLILAIPVEAYNNFFQKDYVQSIISFKNIKMLIYNTEINTIEQWIN